MTAGIDNQILQKLEKWEEKEGTLPGSMEFYRRLLTIQTLARRRIGVPEICLSRETARDRLINGHPLLSFNELSVDWSLLQDIFTEVSTLLSSYSEVWAEIAGNRQFSTSRLKENAAAWFEGTRLPIAEDVDEALWEFMIHTAIKPFLASHGEALLHLVDQELWRRGSCPVCGGSPDFSYLDKERGARWLLCSRCDAGWLFQRLECPYCGTQDQNALSFLMDDKGLYRLYVCHQCQHYLKTIDLRQIEDEVLLPLERLLTLDMDIQAQKDGYSPFVRVNRGASVKQCGSSY